MVTALGLRVKWPLHFPSCCKKVKDCVTLSMKNDSGATHARTELQWHLGVCVGIYHTGHMILEVCWDSLWTLSFRLSQGHGSWLMCKMTFIQSEHVKHITRVLPSTRALPDLAPLFVSIWCDHALSIVRGGLCLLCRTPWPSLERSNLVIIIIIIITTTKPLSLSLLLAMTADRFIFDQLVPVKQSGAVVGQAALTRASCNTNWLSEWVSEVRSVEGTSCKVYVMLHDRGELAVSYKWTGRVWGITGWSSSRLQENYRLF